MTARGRVGSGPRPPHPGRERHDSEPGQAERPAAEDIGGIVHTEVDARGAYRDGAQGGGEPGGGPDRAIGGQHAHQPRE